VAKVENKVLKNIDRIAQVGVGYTDMVTIGTGNSKQDQANA
jgi:hypothetical protein